MLCQQTLPKRCIANVKMTSYCDITISVCSILEFGRGAYNQAVAPGITTPLHAPPHIRRGSYPIL